MPHLIWSRLKWAARPTACLGVLRVCCCSALPAEVEVEAPFADSVEHWGFHRQSSCTCWHWVGPLLQYSHCTADLGAGQELRVCTTRVESSCN
jgi:hypothetical protein